MSCLRMEENFTNRGLDSDFFFKVIDVVNESLKKTTKCVSSYTGGYLWLPFRPVLSQTTKREKSYLQWNRGIFMWKFLKEGQKYAWVAVTFFFLLRGMYVPHFLLLNRSSFFLEILKSWGFPWYVETDLEATRVK